ncbi:MAG TPA: hypothetical protein VFP17_03470 [Solirubrobacterales bacterium]|nr:hypothetical protein [Solirubrobacterales bacterium]
MDSQNHKVFVTAEHGVAAFEASGEPAEFTAGPGTGSSEISGLEEPTGVAVDSNGAIYVSDNTANTIMVFAPTGELITKVSAGDPGNLAVAPDGTLYVIEPFIRKVAKYSPSEFPVTGATTYTAAGAPIDSNETYGIGVDPISDNLYLTQLEPERFSRSRIAVYDEAGTLVETLAEPGEEGELFHEASGIAVNGATGRIYASTDDDTSGGDFSQVRIFGPEEIFEERPAILASSPMGVSAEAAMLRATINPNTALTTYQFEYGMEDCSVAACMSVPVEGGQIAAGHQPVAVSQSVTGLVAGATYHYRVIAENSFGTTEGPDRTFTTQASGLGSALSDSRVWEMVSPSDKHGGTLMGSRFGLIQAAADGEGLAYASLGSIESAPEGNRNAELSDVLATRGADGWESRDITPSNSRVVPLAIGFQTEFNLFTADLSRALVEPRDGTQLSPLASERTPYLWVAGSPPQYTPLVTGKEGFANVPVGTEFGGPPDSGTGEVRLVSADAALDHIVLVSETPLVAGAPEAPLPALYGWQGGVLQPVSELPATEGGKIVAARWIGSGPGSVRNAVSEDGSRVFWSPGGYGTSGNALTALYLRDTQAEETTRLDEVQTGASGTGQERPAFQGASADGTIVFFSDSQQLTADASKEGRDLYRCEIPPGSPAGGCASLTDITASSEDAEVLGLTAGISDDADRIYFVARGVLDNGPNGFGETAKAGQPNLYSWHEGVGVRYIATLSEEDDGDWGGEFGQTYELSPAASPDGSFFAFPSERSLTGYDNRDAKTGGLDQEVFRYDAATDQLSCVSCQPTGGAPLGDTVGEGDRPLVDPQEQWRHRSVSAALPEPTIMETAGVSLYQPRVVLGNGRIFFNSFEALVPADSNGEWDVYQFEPFAVGSCSAAAASATVAVAEGGCVSLISSGTGSEEVGFLDGGASGDDAFFLTPARLSALDSDSELDVYDARVNGREAILSPAEECIGEGCQPAAVAPGEVGPSSAMFSGPGNVKTKHCPNGRRAVRQGGRVKCVPKKHRHRHHGRKAGNGKGGQR